MKKGYKQALGFNMENKTKVVIPMFLSVYFTFKLLLGK